MCHAQAQQASSAVLCNAGLQHDPNNAGLKSDLETAQADQARKKRGQGLFGAQMLAKLAVNPKTSGFMQQPDFMRMMQDINNNPDRMGNYLGDPRFQMALEVCSVSVLKRLLSLVALHCLTYPGPK